VLDTVVLVASLIQSVAPIALNVSFGAIVLDMLSQLRPSDGVLITSVANNRLLGTGGQMICQEREFQSDSAIVRAGERSMLALSGHMLDQV